jgi:hypothetical protein
VSKSPPRALRSMATVVRSDPCSDRSGSIERAPVRLQWLNALAARYISPMDETTPARAVRVRTPPSWSGFIQRTILILILCAAESAILLTEHHGWLLLTVSLGGWALLAGSTVWSLTHAYRKRQRGDWPPPPNPNAPPVYWPDQSALTTYLRRRREQRQEAQ